MAKREKEKYEIPDYAEKAMGIDGPTEEDVREKHPNATILSWSAIAASAWYYLTYLNRANSSHGIFPPNLTIDRTHTPEGKNGHTHATIYAVWHDSRNIDGQLIYIIPSQCEVRVYEKNVTATIREILQRSIPTTALMTYMMHVVMHEYIHFMDMYDLSDKAWRAHRDVVECDEKDTAKLKRELNWWYQSVNELDAEISEKTQGACDEEEYRTDRYAIVSTLTCIALNFFDPKVVSKATHGLGNIIPGDKGDMMLRERGNRAYNEASLMCEYLWIYAQLTYDKLDEDREEQLVCRSEELVKELKEYGKGMYKSKLILLP